MIPVVRCLALPALLVLTLACDNTDRPTAPSSSQPPPTPPAAQPPPPPVGQPPLTGAATTYPFSGPLSYPVNGYTTSSRFVLYDNGAFALEYAGLNLIYQGTHHREGSSIYFDFSADGLWDASGALKEDLLEVQYSDQMQHSDFDNAVYKRSQ